VCALHRIQDVTLLLVASEIGKLYVFGLDLLEAGRSCPLLNEFQLYTSAEVSVCFTAFTDTDQEPIFIISLEKFNTTKCSELFHAMCNSNFIRCYTVFRLMWSKCFQHLCVSFLAIVRMGQH